MATIQKRGKSFRIRAYSGYDLDGKQIERTITWTPPDGMTDRQAEKEAQRQAVLFEEKIRNGEACNGRIRFADFAEQWLVAYAQPQLRPRTVARYEELLVRINAAIGHLSLDKIRPTHLLDFYRCLGKSEPSNASYICTVNLKSVLKERKITKTAFSALTGISLTTLSTAYQQKPISRKSADKISAGLHVSLESFFRPTTPGKSLSSSTIQHYHRLISNILNDAVGWQYIPYNPCSRISAPKADTPDIEYLDDDQAKHLAELISHEPGYYQRPILILLLTGLRRSELLGLEWQDIDWSNKTLRVVRTSQCLPQQGVFTDFTKNETSKRLVIISDQVVKVLQEQYLWQQQQRKQFGSEWIDSQRLVTAPNGAPIHPDRLTHWFSKFIKRTDLPQIHLHSLRHTYATLCIAKGVPITAVAAQLGHANVSTTTTIYAHAIKSAQIAAADKVGYIFEDII